MQAEPDQPMTIGQRMKPRLSAGGSISARSVISMSSGLHAASLASYRARVRSGMVFALLICAGMGNGFHCRNSDSGEKDEGVLQLVEENLSFEGLIKMHVMLIFAGLHLAPTHCSRP